MLGAIERVGNKLPHPATLFAMFAFAIIIISGIAAWLDVSAVHPGTGERYMPST